MRLRVAVAVVRGLVHGFLVPNAHADADGYNLLLHTLLHTHNTPAMVLRVHSCSQSTFAWLSRELQLQFHMDKNADLFSVPLCPSISHDDDRD